MVMDQRQMNAGCGGVDSNGSTVSKMRLFGKTILLGDHELQSTCNSSLTVRSFSDPADHDSQACIIGSSLPHQNWPTLLLQEEHASSSETTHEPIKLISSSSSKRPYSALTEQISKPNISPDSAVKPQKRKIPYRKSSSIPVQEQHTQPQQGDEKTVPCPRCGSLDTKFCYYNNYNLNQPRHFCKACHRYWTAGGALRHVPLGAGRRKTKHSSLITDIITVTKEPAPPPLITAPISSPTRASNHSEMGLQPKLSLTLDQNCFGKRSIGSSEKGSERSMEASPTSPLMGCWSIELQNSSPDSSRGMLPICEFVSTLGLKV